MSRLRRCGSDFVFWQFFNRLLGVVRTNEADNSTRRRERYCHSSRAGLALLRLPDHRRTREHHFPLYNRFESYVEWGRSLLRALRLFDRWHFARSSQYIELLPDILSAPRLPNLPTLFPPFRAFSLPYRYTHFQVAIFSVALSRPFAALVLCFLHSEFFHGRSG